MNDNAVKSMGVRNLLFLAMALTTVLATSPSHALFEGRVEAFSAEMVSTDPGGKVVHTAELYVTKDAMRIDNLAGADTGAGPPLNLTMLVLKKQNLSYVYNLDKKLVYQGPVEEKELVPGYAAMGGVESEKVLGREKVSGYDCVKKEVVTRTEMMGMVMRNKVVVWENENFDFPLRTLSEDGAVQEVRNIEEGAPPAGLFRPMAGYRKVDSMMAVMGMDMSAMMAAEGETAAEMNREAPPPDLRGMDTGEALERMSQAMGEHMSPEEKQQFMGVLASAMNRAKQTKQGPGACAELWRIIPKRSGDEVGYEMKTEGLMDVVLGTQASLREVFDDYREKLTAAGWEDGGSYMQGDFGMMAMKRGEQTIQINAADKPAGMTGDYRFYYDIQYSAPPQR